MADTVLTSKILEQFSDVQLVPKSQCFRSMFPVGKLIEHDQIKFLVSTQTASFLRQVHFMTCFPACTLPLTLILYVLPCLRYPIMQLQLRRHREPALEA